MAACPHAADEHLGVERVSLHPDAVAQDGATSERRVGVGGDHSHGPVVLAQRGDERIDEGRLAGSGSPGEADDVGPRPVCKLVLEGADRRVAFFDEADRAGQGPDVAGAEPLG